MSKAHIATFADGKECEGIHQLHKQNLGFDGGVGTFFSENERKRWNNFINS